MAVAKKQQHFETSQKRFGEMLTHFRVLRLIPLYTVLYYGQTGFN